MVSLKSKTDQKTCCGAVPVLCGTDAISSACAELGNGSVGFSRQAVSVRGAAGESPWAASHHLGSLFLPTIH